MFAPSETAEGIFSRSRLAKQKNPSPSNVVYPTVQAVIIAVFFVEAFIDPVRNVWILHAGIIACSLVIPLALICGGVRQIPVGWRLIDCSFGVFASIPLIYCLKMTRKLENKLKPQMF